jgi:RNA polymerase sigma-70 factor (ECF subfamily)
MSVDNPQLLILLDRITQKDQCAMAEFYKQTQAPLKAYLCRMIRDSETAEEVLQDIYCQVWLKVSDFQADRGQPSAWLYTIARSRALDALRRDRRKAVTQTLEDYTPGAAVRDAEVDGVKVWRHSRVRKGVRDLPESHRELILLAFFEGYCHSEIAGETGLPLGTVKTRIRRALLMLRQGLSHGYC